jgi:LDH2 family malate/lactate/ureidoglycolate dehydrogenase
MPQVFLKAIGISHVANILSGTLGGQVLPEFDRRSIRHKAANQSGYYMAIDIERFVPIEAFKADMDHLMTEVKEMVPLPGLDESTLPGGRAWRKETDYLQAGIPISNLAVKSLETLAREFKIPVPWPSTPQASWEDA